MDPQAARAIQSKASVQVHGRIERVEDPVVKARVLAALMAKFQPEGGHVPIDGDHPLYRKAIAGIQQHCAGVTSIVLDGVTFKPADLVQILQDQIDHADATSSAKATFHQTVAAQNAADAAPID